MLFEARIQTTSHHYHVFNVFSQGITEVSKLDCVALFWWALAQFFSIKMFALDKQRFWDFLCISHVVLLTCDVVGRDWKRNLIPLLSSTKFVHIGAFHIKLLDTYICKISLFVNTVHKIWVSLGKKGQSESTNRTFFRSPKKLKKVKK